MKWASADAVLERWERGMPSLIGLLAVVIVWSLPVFPGQDFPQHLSYVRIFMDYETHASFRELYLLPEKIQPYFTPYFVLAGLGRWIGLMPSFRVLLSFYLLFMILGVSQLVASVHDGAEPRPATSWLVGWILFNPVILMGFLSYVVCLPIFLFGCAAFIRSSGARRVPFNLGIAAVAGVALSSIHVFAGAAFVWFLVIWALSSRRRADVWKVALVAVTMIWSAVAWSLLGGLGAGAFPERNWGELWERGIGLQALTEVFRTRWGDPPTKLSYVLWHLLGPYRPSGQGVQLLGGLTLVVVVWTAIRRMKPSTPSKSETGRIFTRAFALFLASSWLAPWGIYVPSELTFIDFRLLTLCAVLFPAVIPPHFFDSRRAKLALGSFAIFSVVHFGYRAHGFSEEAAEVIGLLEAHPDQEMMATLVFSNGSEHFGRVFRLTHFLPMYHTALFGGANTQFWARFTEHLPIDYRSEHRPDQASDWYPAQFQPAMLRSSSTFLVQRPSTRNTPRDREAYERIMRTLTAFLRPVRCSGLWCLYELDARALARMRQTERREGGEALTPHSPEP